MVRPRVGVLVMVEEVTSIGPEQLLSLRQVGARCGVSVRCIYKLLSTDRFGPRVTRLGRAVRVLAADLDLWLRLGCPRRDEFEAQRASVARGSVGDTSRHDRRKDPKRSAVRS